MSSPSDQCTRLLPLRLACGWLLTPLLVLAAACGPQDEQRSARFRPLVVGEAAPVYATRLLSGDSARVGPGEPLTLLNVWATWCIPCEKELPDLEALHDAYGERGLRILGVSVDAGAPRTVEAYVAERGLSFTIGHDPDERVRMAYQTIGVPESFLIGQDGRLLWRHIGPLPSGGGEGLRAAIEAALAG